MEPQAQIRELIDGVRRRWRRVRVSEAAARGALAASAVLGLGLLATRAADRSPLALIAIVVASAALAAAALWWQLAAVRQPPSDRRVARFIEEHDSALDDCLAAAVDVLTSSDAGAPGAQTNIMARSLLADAAARACAVDLDAVVPSAAVRRATWRAAAAGAVLLTVTFFIAGPARRSVDAASLLLFPSRVQLSVHPGDARIIAGQPIAIEAHLVGNRAPVHAAIQIEQGQESRLLDMARGDRDGFRFAVDAVTAPFRYRIVAGAVTSPVYAVSVARPPHVTRIDLDYTYPQALAQPSRSEQDGGDIYAPAGTSVRVRVHTDLPAENGRLVLSGAGAIPLAHDEGTVMSAILRVTADSAYRVALADRDGLSSDGDTEYFIRVLEDRPPEVHLTKPASDRAVTRLEEVDIEVQADDDHAVERLELVYGIRGGAEKVVPLVIPPHATSVTARHTLYLEDLDLMPGDFVSYYVRAWDLARGRPSREARSDIFFLDVRPYEQEFTLAQSQSMAGSGYGGALDELVNRQRQVVVATWKLDRRADAADGARSDRDIRAVGATETDLQALVQQTASTFRESTMRDPGRRAPVSSAAPRPEEDAMTIAARAMGGAAGLLESLKTHDALAPEMEALNQLLRAQAEIKRRQLTTNQSAAGNSGNTNRNYDISTLFDRELQRQQQTNYETAKGAERPQPAADPLDRIKELAKRQDALLHRQQELARATATPDERKRELERLTREQTELRQRAEELTQQLSEQRGAEGGPSSSTRNARGRDAEPQGGTSAGAGAEGRRQMRDVAEQMRQAASDLRRGAPQDAGASGGRALEQLRDLQRRMQAARPEERRRVLGDLQLEARQLADAQRQLSTDLDKAPSGSSGAEALRRLSADEERLAERMRRLQDDLQRQAAAPRGQDDRASEDAALRDALRELNGLADRTRRTSDELRKADSPARAPQRSAQQDIARKLDRVVERLGVASGAKEDDARKLSEQLARAEELREKLEQSGRAMANARQEKGRGAAGSRQTAGDSGRTGEGRQGAGGTDLSRLREDSLRQLQETKNLLEELQRQDPSFSRNGAGFTFEGQGMVLSAPGTEGFKQDFEKWDQLKRQALAALDQAGATLAKKVQAAAAKDRLAGGAADAAPPDYQKQVDAYFKSLAGRRP